MHDKNNYKCHDIFMVRTPSLPLDIYLDLEGKYYGNSEKLITDYNLYNFFEENLFITSKNLYNSFKKFTINNEVGKDKKVKGYRDSILKYLIRTTTRPTPFGGFSKVGLLEFDNDINIEENNIKIYRDSTIKKISTDNAWLHYVINLFENDPDILYQLNLKINPLSYKFGDRFKNPFCTNFAFSNSIVKNNIKYSFLIEFIKEELRSFKSFECLTKSILKIYENVDINIIKKTIITLIKSEFILTDLRVDVLSENPLEYLITKLDNIDLSEDKREIYLKLKEINSLIYNCNCNYNFKDIKQIIQVMESIHKTSTYLAFNSGIEFINHKVGTNIKEDLEEFANLLKYLYVDKRVAPRNELLVTEFQEEYGTNVEIPFLEFIDENGFNAAAKYRIVNNYSDTVIKREEDIKNLFEKKITQSLLDNSDEIVINKNDIEKLKLTSSDNTPISFDLSIFITKNDENIYNYFIGPNMGCDEGGVTFQRFEEVFDKHLFKKYSQVYDKKKELVNNNYIVAEIKAISSDGRMINVLNKTKNYEHHINFGFPSYNNEGQINIEDLSIGVDYDNLFYIIYKNSSRIKFVFDNMLNPATTNNISYMLYSISSNYNDSLIYRIYSLNNSNKYYIPRIKFGKVVVHPKTWFLHSKDFSLDNFSKFILELKDYMNRFSINHAVYLKNNDNRLILNLDNNIYTNILFTELKKNELIELSELESNLLDGSIVSDENCSKYVSEFAFTFVKDSNSIYSEEFPNNKLIDDSRNFNLFSDGWIYMKIYGTGDRDLNLLNSIIYELKPNLDPHLFFFIRYSDNIGDHLRIRFKFENKEASLKNIGVITNWLEEMQERKMFYKVTYDTYKREINRYGGLDLINKVEELFEADSEFVISLLNKFNTTDEKDLEEVFLFGVVSSLKTLTNNLLDLQNLLEGFDNLESRKKFHKNSNRYVNLVENILNDNLDDLIRDEIILKNYLIRKNILLDLKYLINNQKSFEEDFDVLKNLYLSISHMYCNRLYANRNYEDEILSLTYLSINKILNKLKYKK